MFDAFGPSALPGDPLEGSTIRIPERRNVVIDRHVQEVIDHPAFQRLRRVRALGPTHLVYPGAVHTRFEHSLGVFSTTRWYLASLGRHPSFAASASEEDLKTALAAGLLHDLGHYPFAHSLEALHLKGRDTPRHEDVGARILLGEVEALRGERPIGEILREGWGVDPERVVALCTGDLGEDPSAIDRILHSVISSAIDADKMDYLERDSHHMGVPYGRMYDRGRLLDSLTLNADEDGVAVAAKGKVNAEMFIFSRYTMFSEAYWHHTVRAASAMVESALAAFHTRASMSPDELLGLLLAHDDDRLLEWLCEASSERSGTHYLLRGMVGHRRALYKRVSTFSRAYVEEDKRQAYDVIYAMDAESLYALTDRLRVAYSSALGTPLHPADLIIDTPPRDKDRIETIDVLYPGDPDPRVYPLHKLSRVVEGVASDFVRVVKKIRLFAAPHIAERLRAHPDAERILLEEIL
jgi:HD superfamily phosphohydrolase